MSLTKRIVGLVVLALTPALAVQGYNEYALRTARAEAVRNEAMRAARNVAADLGQFGRGARQVLGILAGLLFTPDVPLQLEPYLPIAVVAALDAVFGGLRAFLDGIFDDKVFVVSFVSNVVIAAAIVAAQATPTIQPAAPTPAVTARTASSSTGASSPIAGPA